MSTQVRLRVALAAFFLVFFQGLAVPQQPAGESQCCSVVRQALDGSLPSLSGATEANGNSDAKGSHLLARRLEPERGAFAANSTRARPRRPGLS